MKPMQCARQAAGSNVPEKTLHSPIVCWRRVGTPYTNPVRSGIRKFLRRSKGSVLNESVGRGACLMDCTQFHHGNSDPFSAGYFEFFEPVNYFSGRCFHLWFLGRRFALAPGTKLACGMDDFVYASSFGDQWLECLRFSTSSGKFNDNAKRSWHDRLCLGVSEFAIPLRPGGIWAGIAAKTHTMEIGVLLEWRNRI